MRIQIVAAVLAVSSVCFGADVAYAECRDRPEIGVVARATGGWLVLPSEEAVVPGLCVAEGDSLAKTDRGVSGEIAIFLTSGAPFTWNCKDQSCRGTIRVPQPPARDRGFVALLRSWWGGGRPIPPVFAIARGAGDALIPAVVERHGELLQLAEALSALNAGQYRFRLTRQDATGPPLELSATVPGPAAMVPALADGLYALERIGETGETIGSAAAVLVVQDQPEARVRFADALEEASSWQGVDTALKRAFLTQILLGIHAQIAQQ